MRIKLILQRTGTDQYSAWNEFKEIPAEIPLNKKWGWEVVGAIWEEDAQNTWEKGMLCAGMRNRRVEG